MKITSINRESLRLINNEIDKAIQAVGDKYGISIKTGNASFSPDTATTKVIISVISEDGTVKTPEVKDFDLYKNVFGIKKNLYDTFTFQGDSYTIVGIKASSRKYPVIGKRADGKEFKFTVDSVNR